MRICSAQNMAASGAPCMMSASYGHYQLATQISARCLVVAGKHSGRSSGQGIRRRTLPRTLMCSTGSWKMS